MSYFLSKKYDDLKVPTEWQREKLCEMMYRAFLEVRNYATKEPERMSDLADAFHNLPAMLYSEDFSIKYFRLSLQIYHEKYPKQSGELYLEMLDKIIK
jgi:hypothetical protein